MAPVFPHRQCLLFLCKSPAGDLRVMDCIGSPVITHSGVSARYAHLSAHLSSVKFRTSHVEGNKKCHGKYREVSRKSVAVWVSDFHEFAFDLSVILEANFSNGISKSQPDKFF